MVNPWPEVIVVVPLEDVNAPLAIHPVPEAVKTVVDAPPAAVKSPVVTVEDACERKPFGSVRRPVNDNDPIVAEFALNVVVVAPALNQARPPNVETLVTLRVGTCTPK